MDEKAGEVCPRVPVHPCQYSPEVIEVLRDAIEVDEAVHDPFAGTGTRLAALCDEIGATYTGTDIEDWPGRDPRVAQGDSTDRATYPSHDFTVVTSPVYLNKRLADYANGPLPTTRLKGRRDYGISLGRALADNNLARHTGRASRAEKYWDLHKRCVQHWGTRVLLNVDSPIWPGWQQMLERNGYQVVSLAEVYTRRYKGLANAEKRADYEVLGEVKR